MGAFGRLIRVTIVTILTLQLCHWLPIFTHGAYFTRWHHNNHHHKHHHNHQHNHHSFKKTDFQIHRLKRDPIMNESKQRSMSQFDQDQAIKLGHQNKSQQNIGSIIGMSIHSSKKREFANNYQNNNLLQDNSQCLPQDSSYDKRPAVFGLRCDNGEMVDGELLIKANEPAHIILIGQNLELNFSLALTPTKGEPGQDCTHLDRVKSIPVLTYLTTTSAQVTFNLPWPGSKIPYYMCIRELKEDPYNGSSTSLAISNNPQQQQQQYSTLSSSTLSPFPAASAAASVTNPISISTLSNPWYHQGSHNLVRLYVHEEWMPLYMKILLIGLLLMISGLFSGLNLGLMALDKNELAVIISCGSEKEKRYARAIEPVRRRGNYLLCSILFSNVLVNSTVAVLLEELTGGSVAVMTSTIFIVMFGEIIPQAFCSRHGLAVGAKTVAITYLCMFLTCPLSYPVSACLDWALGEEINHAYDRERLMEFIRITSDYNNLETQEVNIISGALKLKRVHLSEVMTRIEDTFMLDVNSVLDFDTIKAIVERGYSRVPVHEANNKRQVIAILLTKDLALLDPDDKTPVQTLISFYSHPVISMFEDTTLHEALNEFKTGRSHMAFIRRVIDDGDRDPLYEVTGIVTLEDVIEEILQMEINDETDTVTDNKRRRRRKEAQVRNDFLQFTSRHSSAGDWSHDICVTPQLCLAAYQFLSTNVEPFSNRYISDFALKRLLAKKIYHKVRVESLIPAGSISGNSHNEDERFLYRAGQEANHFIMILEGRVSVTCGLEGLVFEGGPFSYFGKSAMRLDCDQSALMQWVSNQQRPSKVSSNQEDGIQSNFVKNNFLSPSSSNHLGFVDKTRRASSQSIPPTILMVDDTSNDGSARDRLNPKPAPITSSITDLSKLTLSNLDEKWQPGNRTSFVPDFTVQVISNASYLKITRQQYFDTLKETFRDKTQFGGLVQNDSFIATANKQQPFSSSSSSSKLADFNLNQVSNPIQHSLDCTNNQQNNIKMVEFSNRYPPTKTKFDENTATRIH